MIIVVIAALAGIGVVGWSLLSKRPVPLVQQVQQAVGGQSDDTQPPLKIKHIGIDLGAYDPATNRAGDIVFTKSGLDSYGQRIFMEFGLSLGANSAAEARMNPQPTFILPLGTKVRSMVDGEVVKIDKLYSNDYSVMVAKDKNSSWVYELEHVINPTVAVGDKVTAGQIVAEVSPHDSQYHPGFGLYEIGILRGGNPPQHFCPFNYLDDSIKQSIADKLKAFYKSWEQYQGNTDLHDEATQTTPGCLTFEAIAG